MNKLQKLEDSRTEMTTRLDNLREEIYLLELDLIGINSKIMECISNMGGMKVV